MATAQELIDRLNQLEDQRNALDDAEQTTTGFRVGGRNYTRSQLTAFAKNLDKDIKAVRKTLKPYFDAERKVTSASQVGPGQELTSTQRSVIAKAQREFDRIANQRFEPPALVTRPEFFSGVTGGVSGPFATPAPPTPMEATTRQVRGTPQGSQGATGPDAAARVVQGAQSTRGAQGAQGAQGARGATGTNQSTGSAGATGTGRGSQGQTGETVTFEGKKVKVGGKKWKQIIQEEFGSLWDIYNSNADVRKVIDRAVKEGWYNDTNKMKAALSNTNWWRTTQASERGFMTRKSTDPATLQAEIDARATLIRETAGGQGYSLPDEAINRLAENSLKYNYTETQLNDSIGSEAVAQATAGGPQGMTELRRGRVGVRLRELADLYAYKADNTFYDNWINRIATGQSEEAEYEQFLRSQAASYYKSLAPQIERGVDVKTATTMYRQQAANVLNIDPETVDWTQDKWNKALNYQDPKSGEYRQMDSWEWNRYLRSLPEWQETEDAKRTYRNAAFTLAQAFGRTG